MMLEPGFHDVPLGHVATVVTYLELRQRPEPRPDHAQGLSLRRVEAPDAEWYRDLYTRVGGLDWLWFSRLEMDKGELAALIGAAGIEVYALEADGKDQGLLELDFRVEGECELAFFGLTGEVIGQGAGRWLMNRALERAWAKSITRLHVHTCTLDHPAALSFYRRSGFTPIRQQIEIDKDPRLSGTLPESAGAHVPILR